MGFFDKMKNMIGIEDQYEDEDYSDEYAYQDQPSYDKSYEADDASDNTNDYASDYSSTGYEEPSSSSTSSRLSKVIDMASGSSRMRISIQEPLEYDDGPKVLDNIAQARTVILNLEMLEVDKKRQIFDFVSGGVYALNGNIQKVTKDIYVIVPKGVDVDAAVKESVSESSMYQL
ncbi:cell division protein SepF [Levyella massiliensis]|uniref:cell division protein SepF n=1 Tax=Levyella massiliensis TaxID=938289 RepID=UPI0024AE0698|nr:cell division protein SepF [Levyella massiliensis]